MGWRRWNHHCQDHHCRGDRVKRCRCHCEPQAVAVGTGLAASPPHRSGLAAFPHPAPASGDTIAPFGVLATHAVAQQSRAAAGATPTRFCARNVFHGSASPRPGAFPPSAPPPVARPCLQTSSALRTCPTSRARASSASALRLPDAGRSAIGRRSGTRSPRFRRVPFLRDVLSDPARASVPRIAAPHMLPSTLLTVSASATFGISRLNDTPHRIVVYASHPSSPTNTQYSLPGVRYSLPGPVFHRLDHASFAWRTSNPHPGEHLDGDCFACDSQ